MALESPEVTKIPWYMGLEHRFKTLSTSLPADLVPIVEAEAKKAGVSRSMWIRRLIESHLETIEHDQSAA